MSTKTDELLSNAQNAVENASYQLSLFATAEGRKKFFTLQSFITFARSVKDVMKQLRRTESGFEEWSKSYLDEIQSDPLLHFFDKMRSDILKEGVLKDTFTKMQIHHLSSNEIVRHAPPLPHNATGNLIVDMWGRVGWEIRRPNGTIRHVYGDLPKDLVSVELEFKSPPKYHLGRNIEGASIYELCQMYLSYMTRLVDEASEEYGN